MKKFSFDKLIVFCVTLFCIGCTNPFEPRDENPQPSVAKLALQAWNSFENGNYETALSKFIQITYHDTASMVGYHGKAWSYFLLNEPEIALDNFDITISKGNTSNDPIAGLALAYHASSEYSNSITEAKQLLENNSNYSLQYQPEINSKDVRLVLGMSYFHIGDLAKAQEQVDILAQSLQYFSYDPINPDSSNSWIFNNIEYNSYAEVLMVVIDSLDIRFGM